MGPAAGSSLRMQPSHWRRNNCRTSSTLLHGTRSLALQVWLAGQFCCRKPSLALALSWTLCRMGAPAWRDPIFLDELRRRLGVPDAARDTWCPRCNGILDAHSHHAGMCLAGGDRTRRHHAARGLVAAWATCAGLAPELEKAELLLPQWPDDARLALRRPADVYIFPLLRAPQLRLSWPSLAACGWSCSRKLDGMPWQLQVSTATSRSRTWTRPNCALHKGYNSGPWWRSQQVLGTLRLHKSCSSSLAVSLPEKAGTLPPPKPLFSKSFRSPSAPAMGSAQSPGYFGCCNHGCRRSRAGPCRRSVRTPWHPFLSQIYASLPVCFHVPCSGLVLCLAVCPPSPTLVGCYPAVFVCKGYDLSCFPLLSWKISCYEITYKSDFKWMFTIRTRNWSRELGRDQLQTLFQIDSFDGEPYGTPTKFTSSTTS